MAKVSVEIQEHRVTVSDVGGTLQMACTCGQPGAEWCQHVLAVATGDRTAIRPSKASQLLQASKIVEQHVDVTAVLTERLDEARKNPVRADEVQALGAIIARRIKPRR